MPSGQASNKSGKAAAGPTCTPLGSRDGSRPAAGWHPATRRARPGISVRGSTVPRNAGWRAGMPARTPRRPRMCHVPDLCPPPRGSPRASTPAPRCTAAANRHASVRQKHVQPPAPARRHRLHRLRDRPAVTPVPWSLLHSSPPFRQPPFLYPITFSWFGGPSCSSEFQSSSACNASSIGSRPPRCTASHQRRFLTQKNGSLRRETPRPERFVVGLAPAVVD